MKSLKHVKQLQKLTPHERKEMRGMLLQHMQAYPMPAQPKRSLFLRVSKPVLLSLSSLLLLTAAGATAFAAEGSLPGDLLYPVKVQVTEPLRSALATSPEQRAAWEEQLAQRRVDEVKTLINQDQLSPQRNDIVDQQLNQQIDDAKKTLDDLQEQGQLDRAVELSTHLEENLKEHHDLIENKKKTSEDDHNERRVFQQQLQKQQEDLKKKREELDAQRQRTRTEDPSDDTSSATKDSSGDTSIDGTRQRVEDQQVEIHPAETIEQQDEQSPDKEWSASSWEGHESEDD